LLCILQKTNGEVELGFNGDLYPTAGADVVMTTSGDMVKYQSGARARLGIGSANQILQVKSSLPSWETVDLADTVLTTAGDVLYENATPELARLPKGTQYNNLQMGASLPAWSASPTSVLTGAMDILYSSSANTLARLGAGSDGKILTTHSTGSAPTWETPSAGGAYTELANVTISGSTNNKIESGTLSTAGMRFLHVSFHGLYVTGQDPTASYLTLNDNDSAIYEYRTAINDVADVTATGQTFGEMGASGSSSDVFINGYITSLSGDVANWIFHSVYPHGGGTTTPQRAISCGYYDDTAVITSVEFRNETTRLWDIGSQLIVTGIT